MERKKINWGGLIETVYSQPDFTHESERLKTLKRKLDELEAYISSDDTKILLGTFTENDRNYLCSPVLDAIIPMKISHAVQKNSLEAVIFLIERGVLLELYDDSLQYACINRNMAIIEYLVSLPNFQTYPRHVDLNVAMVACTRINNLEALQFLIRKFPLNLHNSFDIYVAAFYYGHKEIYEFIYSHVSDTTKGDLANRESQIINETNVEAIKFLVDRGYFRPSDNYILFAAARKSLQMFKYIFTLVSTAQHFLDHGDKYTNPLYAAIEYDRLDIVQYVVEELKIPIQPFLLTEAVRSGSERIVTYLLSKNVEKIEAALELAVRNRHFRVAELLRLELCKKSYL